MKELTFQREKIDPRTKLLGRCFFFNSNISLLQSYPKFKDHYLPCAVLV